MVHTGRCQVRDIGDFVNVFHQRDILGIIEHVIFCIYCLIVSSAYESCLV